MAEKISYYEDKNLAYKYAEGRPTYPQTLADNIMDYFKHLREEYSSENKFPRMLDVACGSGQATRLFAPYFESILGTDISTEQIEVARELNENENISYLVVTNNKFPVDDSSIDFVNCATAVHWLDIDQFVDECNRVLKPNGCVALYTYFLASVRLPQLNKPLYQNELDLQWQSIMRSFITDIRGHPRNNYWLEEYRPVFDKIQNKSKKWLKGVEEDVCWSYDQFKKCFACKGEYHKLMKEDSPNIDPLEVFMENIKKFLNVEDQLNDEIRFDITWRFPTVVFTKE